MRIEGISVLLAMVEVVVALMDSLLEASDLGEPDPHPHELQYLDHEQYFVPVLFQTIEEHRLDPALVLASHLHYLAKLLIKGLFKAGLWLLGFKLAVLVGGGFVAAVCTLTSICTLKLPEMAVTEAKMRSYLSTDSLVVLTKFIRDSIDKHDTLQKQQPTEEQPQHHSPQ